MPKGVDKPVVKNPAHSTIEAYKDRHVEIVEKDTTTTRGKIAVVTDKAVVLHVKADGGPVEPKGIVLSEIKSIQEVKARKAS